MFSRAESNHSSHLTRLNVNRICMVESELDCGEQYRYVDMNIILDFGGYFAMEEQRWLLSESGSTRPKRCDCSDLISRVVQHTPDATDRYFKVALVKQISIFFNPNTFSH